MFLKDALLRCSGLEEDVASVYAELAESPAATTELVAAWTESARVERQRARLLHALAELSAALGDDGPFLVQAPVQLVHLRRVVESVRGRVSPNIDQDLALRCAEALDAAGYGDLHRGLLEVAELEIRRVLRLVESQTKSTKRANGQGARSRDNRKVRSTCSSAVS